MSIELHAEIFPKHQQSLFDTLSGQDWIRLFYLAGGTSLALQIGHRRSIDFDFFTEGDFNTTQIISNLRNIGKFELFDRSEDTKMRHLCRRRYNLKVSPYMRDVGVYDFADFLNCLLSVVFQYDGVCHFYHNSFKCFGYLP